MQLNPKGVTDHTELSSVGTNTHSVLDVHVGAAAPHTGHETPAGAQAKVDVSVPTGTILPYAGSTAPPTFLMCNGGEYSRVTYSNLFAKIGTQYGAGDGVTTFNAPDFQGRVLIGAGAGAGLTVRARGDKSGEESHILTTSELAAHGHSHTHDAIAAHSHSHTHDAIGDHRHQGYSGAGGGDGITGSAYQTPTVAVQVAPAGGHTHAADATAGGGHTHAADATVGGGHTHAADATQTGSGTAHNNMMPFGCCNFIIKT